MQYVCFWGFFTLLFWCSDEEKSNRQEKLFNLTWQASWPKKKSLSTWLTKKAFDSIFSHVFNTTELLLNPYLLFVFHVLVTVFFISEKTVHPSASHTSSSSTPTKTGVLAILGLILASDSTLMFHQHISTVCTNTHKKKKIISSLFNLTATVMSVRHLVGTV